MSTKITREMGMKVIFDTNIFVSILNKEKNAESYKIIWFMTLKKFN